MHWMPAREDTHKLQRMQWRLYMPARGVTQQMHRMHWMPAREDTHQMQRMWREQRVQAWQGTQCMQRARLLPRETKGSNDLQRLRHYWPTWEGVEMQVIEEKPVTVVT